jgi:hypothetical protein
MLCALCFLGCSAIDQPDDHYQRVLEMEEYGEQIRRDTGRHPNQIVAPVEDSESVPIQGTVSAQAESSVRQLELDMPQQQVKQMPVVEQEVFEEPPQREIVQEPKSPPVLPREPIAVASDVIKSALNSADLGVSTRAVELVNGRLSGGKNSVRVNFSAESVDVIDDKFLAICAVVYHLSKKTGTVDVVAGIAEDERINILAILQSDMSDIKAWMNNEISRADWFSRITRKIL